ncbi:MAG: hypothetical protein ABIR28_08010 [Vicinamibacteria bacterium]
MSTLADVFSELNALKAKGLVRDYALGGATAVLFYAEPTRTYDVDVFLLLTPGPHSPLISLENLYAWARSKGFTSEAEHIMVHGVPVQFIPAHNSLAEESVAGARTLDYDGVPVRVVDPEHLAALAFQAGGARRRERAWQLIETGAVDRNHLKTLLAAHQINVDIADER